MFNLDHLTSGEEKFSGNDLNCALSLIYKGGGLDLIRALISSKSEDNIQMGYFLVSEADPRLSEGLLEIQMTGLYSEKHELRYASIKAFAEHSYYEGIPLSQVEALASDDSASVRRFAKIWLTDFRSQQ